MGILCRCSKKACHAKALAFAHAGRLHVTTVVFSCSRKSSRMSYAVGSLVFQARCPLKIFFFSCFMLGCAVHRMSSLCCNFGHLQRTCSWNWIVLTCGNQARLSSQHGGFPQRFCEGSEPPGNLQGFHVEWNPKPYKLLIWVAGVGHLSRASALRAGGVPAELTAPRPRATTFAHPKP